MHICVTSNMCHALHQKCVTYTPKLQQIYVTYTPASHQICVTHYIKNVSHTPLSYNKYMSHTHLRHIKYVWPIMIRIVQHPISHTYDEPFELFHRNVKFFRQSELWSMYMYKYVCVYVHVCVHVCMCVFRCIHCVKLCQSSIVSGSPSSHVYVYVWVCLYTYMCMQGYLIWLMHAMNAFAHVIYACLRAIFYVCMFVCVYRYTNILMLHQISTSSQDARESYHEICAYAWSKSAFLQALYHLEWSTNSHEKCSKESTRRKAQSHKIGIYQA